MEGFPLCDANGGRREGPVLGAVAGYRGGGPSTAIQEKGEEGRARNECDVFSFLVSYVV